LASAAVIAGSVASVLAAVSSGCTNYSRAAAARASVAAHVQSAVAAGSSLQSVKRGYLSGCAYDDWY